MSLASTPRGYSPTSSTTITLSKASGGGTLRGTLTGTTSTSSNCVTISTPVYSKADTMLTATATAGETALTPVTSGSIVFSAGAATQLVFTTEPVGNVSSGSTFATQPVVTVEDTNGNTVTSSTASIQLAITNGTATQERP